MGTTRESPSLSFPSAWPHLVLTSVPSRALLLFPVFRVFNVDSYSWTLSANVCPYTLERSPTVAIQITWPLTRRVLILLQFCISLRPVSCFSIATMYPNLPRLAATHIPMLMPTARQRRI